jgi:maltose alpha-D-glucosyltransferase/alpha-amylase
MAKHNPAKDSRPLGAASAWFADAVFYKLPVKSFFDASSDGVGDFRGLVQKLGYLQDLGITCLWLLPFFPSPLADDGYDVTDYRGVHPALGTMDDFRVLVREAHRRGLRIAAEMVINHTSREHPWFQAARAAPPGSPLREFYVWSDSSARFRQAEVLPSHGQRSNWTWDDVAGAFYWHRFSDHQPDLNFDHPEVRAEMLKVLRFWAEEGVDALCLNGAAYLAEREDTSCDHLPETHAVLEAFRSELAPHYPELMIQAGVSAWPEVAAGYFGGGRECHMAPNLALAPRVFLALKQEERQPLVDLVRHTPQPPPGCQWVTLLRNHDELTLSLATDEQRDYLFSEYAADLAMRHRGGILRRLAPLAENNRRRIELLFGLLFALPGAPVIYYGDEIGMGDNVLLGGRRGVRTPMQWSGERNGGFSSADFARLFAPPNVDPIYGYPSVNVEAQLRDGSSLVHWLRRLIAVRRQHPVLATGSIQVLEPENRQILALVRRQPVSAGEERVVLILANLAGVAQPVQLDLTEFQGLIPVELFGGTPFPRIGAGPYPFTLGAHSFFWFALEAKAPAVTRMAPIDIEEVQQLPVIRWSGRPEDLLAGETRQALERALPGFLKSQRWFGGKSRRIEAVSVVDGGLVPARPAPVLLLFLEVTFEAGETSLYFLPVAIVQQSPREALRPLVIARLEAAGGQALLIDALADDDFCRWLLDSPAEKRAVPTAAGTIRAEATAAYKAVRGAVSEELPVRLGPATSSNSLVFFGRRMLLKLFRRLEQGTNPDFEIGRFLTEEHRFARTPEVAGIVAYHELRRGGPFTLAILQALVPNQGDGWEHALDELRRYYDRASARMFAPDGVSADPQPVLELAATAPPAAVLETIGTYLHAAGKLGTCTALMHLALASDATNPDFAPEPLLAADLDALTGEVQLQGEQALSLLRSSIHQLPASAAHQAQELLEYGPAALQSLAAGWTTLPQATKTRVHGDFHLGQVLWVDNDFVILDYEGEPTRTIDERRAKFSPLRDVAGMLRSFHYAAYAGLFSFTHGRQGDFPRLAVWADLWQQWVSAAFLAQYLRTAAESEFLPEDRRQLAQLLDGFVLAKALYELSYELNNRPDWVQIPLAGVLGILQSSRLQSGLLKSAAKPTKVAPQECAS